MVSAKYRKRNAFLIVLFIVNAAAVISDLKFQLHSIWSVIRARNREKNGRGVGATNWSVSETPTDIVVVTKLDYPNLTDFDLMKGT